MDYNDLPQWLVIEFNEDTGLFDVLIDGNLEYAVTTEFKAFCCAEEIIRVETNWGFYPNHDKGESYSDNEYGECLAEARSMAEHLNKQEAIESARNS